MKLGDVTIRFDEEQLKRFEAAAASIPDAMLEQRPTDSVTIEVPLLPLRLVPDAEAIPRGVGGFGLTERQGLALRGLMAGLNGIYPHASATNDVCAIRWLLDQIAEQVEKAGA